MSIFREMREAGLTKSDMMWEVIGGLSIIVVPIMLLFIAHVLG